MPEINLWFGAISSGISSLPASFFLKEMNSIQRKKAIIILILVWLTLLISFASDYLFSFKTLYIIPFCLSIFFLSFCFWVIIFKRSKIKDKIEKE